jgi:hypothetical protein
MNRDIDSPFAISSGRVLNKHRVSGGSLSGSSRHVNVLWGQPKYSGGDKKSTVLHRLGLYSVSRTKCQMFKSRGDAPSHGLLRLMIWTLGFVWNLDIRIWDLWRKISDIFDVRVEGKWKISLGGNFRQEPDYFTNFMPLAYWIACDRFSRWSRSMISPMWYLIVRSARDNLAPTSL